MGAFLAGVQLWEGGIIPYVPDEKHPHWNEIKKAIDEVNSRTVIKFVAIENEEAFKQANADRRYLKFGNASKYQKNYTSCIGYKNNEGQSQVGAITCDIVNSDNGGALHQLGHVIGMINEHQRPDRNDHIAFSETLTKYQGKMSWFIHGQIIDISADAQTMGSYDPKSCMCFDDTAGGNGQAQTMQLVADRQKRFQASTTLSSQDVKCINEKYQLSLSDSAKLNSWQAIIQRYPSAHIEQLYNIQRKQSAVKAFFSHYFGHKGRNDRKNQIFALKGAIFNIERGSGPEERNKAVEDLKIVLSEIQRKIATEKKGYKLGDSALEKICQDMQRIIEIGPNKAKVAL